MGREYIDIPLLGRNGDLHRNQLLGTVEALIPNAPFESCHAADLVELPNGDVLCCWFAGSDEGNADISIVISRLAAGSSQWTKPKLVSEDKSRSEQNPSFFLNPNGELWLVYTAQTARTPETKPNFNLQHTAEILYKKSTDNGVTWTPAKVLFARRGSFCRQKIQVLSSGRWVFGNWICFPDESRNGSDITVVQISDDQGKSWREVEVPNSRGRVHGNILEVATGKLICIFRSRFADAIYISHSQDNGDSWTAPQKTILRNNNSSISAIKLHSGDVALIYNDVSFNTDTSKTVWPNQRCPVTVAISHDEGRTWPWRRVVEHGEGFVGPWNDINNRRYEYPVIMQSADGMLHAAYSWGTRKQVKYISFCEQWIRGEQTCYGAENDPELVCNR